MIEREIPEASLQRLRNAYQQFEMLAGIVAEAMGIPPGAIQQINVQKGVFVVQTELNGVADYVDQLAVT